MYNSYDCLVGKSISIRKINAFIDEAARSDYPVLLLGETGVGKELVARLIYKNSVKYGKAFYPVNIVNIPENLLESELFGHKKGAYTDASNDRIGLFCEAEEGTIFLDEIADSSISLQAKLLRAIDTGEIRKLGEDRPIRINVRFIFATNKNIQEQILKNEFRKDLYYRISVHELEIPPLRDRKADIPILFRHIFDREIKKNICNLSNKEIKKMHDNMPSLIREIEKSELPGNIRELENIAARFITSGGKNDVLHENRKNCVTQKTAEEIYLRIKREGMSFWDIIYKPFMKRKMSCREVAEIIKIGLEESNGSYKRLIINFNISNKEYKRFMDFLRNHEINKEMI